MNIIKSLCLFSLITTSFPTLKPHDVPILIKSVDLFHKSTSIAKLPAAGSVLYAHATSNEKLENIFKIIESLNQILNGSNTTLLSVVSNNRAYIDMAWIGVELFRYVKYIKKHAELIKQEQEKKLSSQQQQNDYEIKPKSKSFKIKIAVCAILAAIETYSSFVSTDIINCRILNIRNLGMSARGLRYFLLSEDGSLEAKISIAMTILSLFEFIIQETQKSKQPKTTVELISIKLSLLEGEQKIIRNLLQSGKNHVTRTMEKAKDNGLDQQTLNKITAFFQKITGENLYNNLIFEPNPEFDPELDPENKYHYKEPRVTAKEKLNIDPSDKNYDDLIMEYVLLKLTESNLYNCEQAIATHKTFLRRF